MQTTWILIADSSRARIFETESSEQNFLEVQDFANPQGRANVRELNTDAYPRHGTADRGQQASTWEPSVNAVEHETELFTKNLSQYLDKARTDHRFDKLCLIAPPKFLGLIRKNLSKEAQKMVEEEIAKDISWFGSKDIEDYLKSYKH